jgi:hypothetical protein
VANPIDLGESTFTYQALNLIGTAYELSRLKQSQAATPIVAQPARSGDGNEDTGGAEPTNGASVGGICDQDEFAFRIKELLTVFKCVN